MKTWAFTAEEYSSMMVMELEGNIVYLGHKNEKGEALLYRSF